MSRYVAVGVMALGLFLSSCTTSPVTAMQNALADRLASNLKDALALSVREVVSRLGAANGYLNNPLVQLFLPPPVTLAVRLLQGAGELLDEEGDPAQRLEKAINLAASAVIPSAAPILERALEQMPLTEARALLTGGETAFTDYLKTKTQAALTEQLQPLVVANLDQSGTLAKYGEIVERFQALSVTTDDVAAAAAEPAQAAEPLPTVAEFERYVTDQAISGLFRMVGAEEQKIRQSPVFQDIELLKTVLGQE